MQVNVIAWDFTKLFLVPFLITAKASTKAGIITVLISAIYKLFPSPNLTIIIIVIIFLQSSIHAKQKQDQNFALTHIKSLFMLMQNCQLQSIRTNSIEPQTISSLAYYIIVSITSVKSVIISMKG